MNLKGRVRLSFSIYRGVSADMRIDYLDRLTQCRLKLDFLSSGFSKGKDDCCSEGLFLILGEIADELRVIETSLSAALKKKRPE